MKKLITLGLALAMTICAMSATAFAAPAESYTIGQSGTSGEVEVTSSQDMELHGNIQPTIISVTVPSYIPFSISRSLPTDNKVVSPRIDVKNNSTVPVSVFVDNTAIDLSQLGDTSWSESGIVNSDQIAIGMVNSQQPPEALTGAKWLADGKQHTNLTDLIASEKDSLYVVGNLGDRVPDNRSFTVIATLVVKAQ